ncbi:CMRF35-like molecule 1 isoform X2 [Zalophus californianus]|uniref:CMRF35-like molecule 1 isoform X2 n=1 Tax=Zalophus californianus TaxID=9704 RepID=A0A6J2FNT1_ZALCA|nr:CMRF35-like molecule 1 isoform X2 [Zalophus californianus]
MHGHCTIPPGSPTPCLHLVGSGQRRKCKSGESRRLEDAGAGSELTGPIKRGLCEEKMNLLLLFHLFQLAGSSDLIAVSNAVSGPVRGSLTVQCRYGPGWETYSKWWCRGAKWKDCRILVQTDGSEQEVKGHHVSIRDNQKSRTFTVTMEELRWNDADTYWCGIERSGTDLGVKVKVTIDPVSTTTTTTTSTTMSTTPAETKGPRTVTSHHSNGSANSMKLSILIPLILAVLLLLLVTASLLALRKMKQQKRAAGISPEQVLQPPEGDLCYANLALEPTSTSHNSSQKKACTKSSFSALGDQQEVEYVTMAPFWKEDISYAALSWEALNQESTYYNMNYHVAQVPSRSHEEPMEYSSIRRS